MPELPEVQTIVNEMLELNIVGKTIFKVDIFWPKIIDSLSTELFLNRLQNQKITRIFRRGKFIVIELSKDFLLVHLRMTGKFFIGTDRTRYAKHEHIRFFLDDGRILHYEDQRKFGRIYLVGSTDVIFDKLGLEPLSHEFTYANFKNIVLQRKTSIKPFLLNQKYIVGLGNIYVDEALWEAKIHPLQLSHSIPEKKLKKLHEAIVNVLEKGIENQGTTLGSHNANYYSVSGRRGDNQHKLNVFRQDGKPCLRCGETIVKIRVAQRGTHFCPVCQKLDA